MPAVTLPPPLFFDAVHKLVLEDENEMLQRLYDRDEVLLLELLAIQKVRDDLISEFERLDDLEQRWRALNRVIDSILAAFFQDIQGDGTEEFDDNVAFFVQLIADLKRNIGAAEELSAQIIRYEDIQALLMPVTARLVELEDLDRLTKDKLDYIYGKWDINPDDDILSV